MWNILEILEYFSNLFRIRYIHKFSETPEHHTDDKYRNVQMITYHW